MRIMQFNNFGARGIKKRYTTREEYSHAHDTIYNKIGELPMIQLWKNAHWMIQGNKIQLVILAKHVEMDYINYYFV